MKIAINKDIEEYKDDAWRGFSRKEFISIILIILIGGGGGFLLYSLCHVPIEIAIYIILPFIVPIGMVGFWPENKNKLTLAQLVKERIRLEIGQPLDYQSTETPEILKVEKKDRKKKHRKNNCEEGEEEYE